MNACYLCHGDRQIERLATPEEVDDGCELGITYDPCPMCRLDVFACSTHDFITEVSGGDLAVDRTRGKRASGCSSCDLAVNRAFAQAEANVAAMKALV